MPSSIGARLPQLSAAAHNALHTCLRLTGEDSFVLVGDATTATIIGALEFAAKEIGAQVRSFDLDVVSRRPLTLLPQSIARAAHSATASAMALTTLPGELALRRAFLEIVIDRKLRHAHMPSITPALFRDGLEVDYHAVSAFVNRLAEHLKGRHSVHLTSPGGSDIEFTYASGRSIETLDGIILPGKWQNLPSGQVVIYPSDARGLFVVDKSIGDWFEHKYDVTQYPVTMEFERGALRQIRCDNKQLERQLGLFLRSSTNSGRISELVVGANRHLGSEHSGALFQAYRPGASISVGAQVGGESSSQWNATTFVNLIADRPSLTVESSRIMQSGAFTGRFEKD